MDQNLDQENQQAEEKLKEELKNRKPEGDELRLGPNTVCDDHNFIIERNELGVVARCSKCPVGYPLGPGAELKQGHIYIHGSLVI